MLSEADEKSTLVLVLSLVVILLVCGAFALASFNQRSFHKDSFELITNPESQQNHQ